MLRVRLLFIGDVVGSIGRRAFEELLPKLREREQPDFVVVNGENAAGGIGITAKIARALLAEVLGSLHRRGIGTASAEVNESNGAAMALFEGIGARRASSNLELVLR